MRKYLVAIYLWTSVLLYSMRAGFQLRLSDTLIRLGLSKKAREQSAHEIGTVWATSIFHSMKGWWEIRVEGKANLLPADVASVFVCNHQSMTDIWALYFVDKPFRWMAKDKLFLLPFTGFGMKMAGYIPVKRHDSRSRLEALARSEQCLREGASMLFFPEGTRSRDGKLLPFKTGAFKLAADLNVPIQPIVIDGAQKLLQKHTMWPGKSTVRIKILPAIYKKESETAQSLKDRARLAIAQTLETLRNDA